MIAANCRERLTAEDFEFIVQTLGRRRGVQASLAELLTDAETRDIILDDETLFSAVLEDGAPLRISPQCYFYIVMRRALRDAGMHGRDLADYLAALLASFSHVEQMRAPGGCGTGPQQYVTDLLLALQKAPSNEAFLLRAHIGNYALFVSGVFHERVEVRSQKRGAPDLAFYERIGAANFEVASHHTLARQHALGGIFHELAERFHEVRVTLSGAADRIFHMDPQPPDGLFGG